MDNVKVTQFCAISGFPGYYVSTDGKVFKGGKEVNPCYNGRGYNKVILYKDGQRKSRAVHRLIAETFIPNPYNLPVVNHINGNKLDNRIENLEWVSYAENTQKFYATNVTQIIPVAKINPRTGAIKEVFTSIAMAAKYHGYDYRTLYDSVKSGRLYRGFLWKHCKMEITITEG